MNNSTTPMPGLLERYGSQAAVLKEFAPVAFYAYRTIPPFWYVIGLFGNPISAYIWLGHAIRERTSSSVYLGALAINDLIFLIIHFMYYLHFTLGLDFYVRPIGCEMFSFSFYIPQYIPFFLVFQFTFERYISLCHPFLKYKLFSLKRTINIILFFIILSIALSSVQIYFVTYKPAIKKCDSPHTKFKKIFLLITESIISFGIPILILLLNALSFFRTFNISQNETSLQKESNKINQTISTGYLLVLSFYFIITQLTLSIMSVSGNWVPVGDYSLSDVEIRRDKTWSFFFTYIQIRKLIESLCVSYYASHFFIFCLTSNYFRLVLVYLFTRNGMMPHRDSVMTETSSSGRKMTMPARSGLKSENDEEQCICLDKRKQEQNTMPPTIDKHITQAHIATYSTEV